jgi:flagellar biosynthesis protein FlhG
LNRAGPKRAVDRPRVVAYGGGKGGTGRSTLCAETARALARKDERVLCLDADWGCPTLNTLFGSSEPPTVADQDLPALGAPDSHIADFIHESGHDGVWLASLASGRAHPFDPPQISPTELIGQLHALDFDCVLLDLPSGTEPLGVSLFALSDIPIAVATPEPSAVRLVTQYFRSALVQSVRLDPDARQLGEALDEILDRQPMGLTVDTLLDAADDLGARDDALRAVVREATDKLETYLVVNLVREGSEQDLGHVLAHAWHEAIGLFPRFLTHAEYEDRRWFYHRRSMEQTSMRGEEKLSRDIERIARSLREITEVDERYPRPIPRLEEQADLHPAKRLGISPQSGRDEVRQHCRRLWEGYGRSSAVDLIFGDSEQRPKMAEKLEGLYREVLQMPNDTFTEEGDAPSRQGRHTPAATSPTIQAGGPRASAGESTHPAGVSATTPTSPGEDSESQPEETSTRQQTDIGGPARTVPASGGDMADDTESRTTIDSTDRSGDALEVPERPASGRPGALVESLRRRAGVTLHDVSTHTEIGIKYLTAIEDGRLDVLPREVYLRNYLRDIAEAFGVDADLLVERYLDLLDAEIGDTDEPD